MPRSLLFPAVLLASGTFMLHLAAAPAGVADSAFASPERELASVGERAIPVATFLREWKRTTPPFAEGQRRVLLDRMVQSELVYAAALREGFDRDPEVQEAVRRLIVGRYRAEKLEPRLEAIQIAPEEVEGYYRTHEQSFAVPRAVRAAVILIRVPDRASAEKKAEFEARAEAAHAEALALQPGTRTFGAVAVKYSEDQGTRYRGGDTGWLEEGRADARWDPEVLAAAFALARPGEIAPVIRSASGLYLVKLVEVRERAVRTFAEVQEQVARLVLQEKRAAIEKAFYEEMARGTTVRVDEALLESLAPPEGARGKGSAPPPLPAQ